MSSNYPPGVTGNEDYFMDDDELRRLRKHKGPSAKSTKEAAKVYVEHAMTPIRKLTKKGAL